MQCIWFSDGAHIWYSTHHIWLSKTGVSNPLFTSPEEYGYINCATCLSLAELDHLKAQFDIERDARLITFDLEDDTVMSYSKTAAVKLNILCNKLDRSEGSIFKNW